MKIAVIGGGAAGLVTSHLLDGAHHVTLIEREPILGGNIRTLGRNVSCSEIPADLYLDAGVIEFERDCFPAVHSLFERLGVVLGEVPGTSGLHLANGRSYLSPGNIRRATQSPLGRLREFARLLPLANSRIGFLRRTNAASAAELAVEPLGTFLDRSIFSLWLRLLVMYAYSIPSPAVDDVPAALAVPMLQEFLEAGRWSRVEGGVYTYVERILDRFGGDLWIKAQVEQVRRRSDQVEVTMAGGTTHLFDAVVFATTPDQVLALLADSSEAETRRFASWRAQSVVTRIHTDDGLYRNRGIRYPSEFDLFETSAGDHGYSAYLNRLSGLGEGGGPCYQLAFHLDGEIDPDRVLHEQRHTTPCYTVEAFRYRDEVRVTNGENRTFHAGAYLGDGLHEGAVRSADAVSRLLGGQEIHY